MKRQILILLTAVALLLGWQAEAQTYDTNSDYVQTFAGSGFSGYVDGVGQLTMFNDPNDIVADSHGNLFVWDNSNYRIREIASDSTVTTFAGGGTGGQSTGVGTNFNFKPWVNSFSRMAIDHSDTIWLASYGQSAGGLYYGCNLFKITSGAVITLTTFQSLEVGGICVDSSNNIYISDWYFNKIYRVNINGSLSVFAGSGNLGYADGNGIFTAFFSPYALAADAADNIYVWDSGNRLIRRIDQSQNVTTFSGKYNITTKADGFGTNAAFTSISAMCFDGFGNLIIADDSSIRKISPTTNIVTMAGNFTLTGYANGAGNLALFKKDSSTGIGNGVCISGGTIYIADSGNERIRSITNNPTSQVVSAANLQLNTYPGLQIIGTVGRSYQIQTSPDLNSWSTKATILLNSSPYIWIDQNPVSGNKFYRALLLP